ncbi:septum formation inhibitor Maf [Lacinutrix sp. MedPE-SW]|uniref:septum formation inhibitor Maf n=1 Tax=Lacinutrix sp. MedPE-SW TaxID=1860087 RepID=UPI000923B514|nr:septum formation inhibitor Maf [Lacinutrix sp. MedPE-SW]OIQ24077.1 MAG: septum formation inhibitor Maf [Lacinutrix sp. MedPE-SW]
MKNLNAFKLILSFLFLCTFFSCKNEKNITGEILEEIKPETTSKAKAFKPNQNFKDYWYSGEAEITSFKLLQSRYGEIREGTAVLVYVTEPFLKDKQVKADQNNASNISVLKLNATKNFVTGVYPYSIMQSTFYPIANNQHAIKVSSSVQEWCGQQYVQLNNRINFELKQHSYFETTGDKFYNIDKAILENELWTKLRINPKSLPIGDIKVIPSLEFTTLNHKPIKAYNVIAKLEENKYSLNFPELNRNLSITFNKNFPYEVISWQETFNEQSIKATKLKTIKSAYWNKKTKKDSILRKKLQLK